MESKNNKPNEYIIEMAKQFKLNYLVKAMDFKAVFDNKVNSMTLLKGKKLITIQYDLGNDLYNVKRLKIMDNKLDAQEVGGYEGFDWEQVRAEIESYFNVQIYFLDQFVGGVN